MLPALLLVALPAAAAATAAAAEPAFVLRRVSASGVELENVCGSPVRKLFIVEQLGSGGALFDYDGDGDLDLYVANGADLEILRGRRPPAYDALYRNDGDWRFADVSRQAGIGDPGWGIGVTAGDADGDGDADLYVANYGPNVYYQNLGDGTFRKTTAGVEDPGMGASAAFADVDGDGDLDLYVTNYLDLDLDHPPQDGQPCRYQGAEVACGPVGLELQGDRFYHNLGGGRFADGGERSGLTAVEPQYGLGLAFADLDDDGWVDLYVANDSGPNFLFHNRGRGRFEEIAWLAGVATEREGSFQAGMGVDAGDADGDGRLDLIVTNFARDHNTLYLNQGGELFEDRSMPSGIGAPSRPWLAWGVRFADFDLDADLDLYVANGHIYPELDAAGARETFRQPDQLFVNDGRGRFHEASERIAKGRVEASRGVASGDVDGDGDLDLVVFELGSVPSLLRNDVAGGGHFLMLELRDGARTEGVGARVRVTAGGRTQVREATRSGSYAVANDARVHLGLGAASRVDRLDIRWPRGKRQVFLGLPADRRYVIVEQTPRQPPSGEPIQ